MPTPHPTTFYVTLSLALVLFLLGLVGWWTLEAGELTRQLQEELDIVVELEDERGPAAADALVTYLKAAPFHRPGTEPAFLPKDAALAALGDDLRRDLDELGLNNPLLDVVTFNVPLDYLATDSLARIAAAVQTRDGVASVYYQDNLFEAVAANGRTLTYILVALIGLFGLVAALLIHNTVRLSLYANRFLIKTQELVGATWGFISRPYLWRSVGQGLLAGLLAAAGVFGLQWLVQDQFPELTLFADPLRLGLLYGGLVVLGVTINFISHYIVVRRYLRLRPDELY